MPGRRTALEPGLPNDQAHRPAHAGVASCRAEPSLAWPVRCSTWILIMAFLGWAEARPKGKRDRGTSPVPAVGFSGRAHLPTTMRARLLPPQGVHDALL